MSPRVSPAAAAALSLSALVALPALTATASTPLVAQGPTEFPAEAGSENVAYEAALFDGMEYRMIGPYRGGRVTAVEGVADRPHTYYMGAVGGGVWRTTDAGESWENISGDQVGVGSIGDVKVADSDHNVIYVGTGSACPRGNVSVGNGVYRSTDAGETWSHVGLPEAGQIGEIAVHPEDPDVAYVAALGHIFGANPERGVYRTRDGGESWEKVLFVSDSTGIYDVEMRPDNPRVLFAAAWRAERKPWTMISGGREGGIWRSKDGGESWTKLGEGEAGEGLPDGVVGKIDVSVSAADPDRVFALIEAPDPEGGLYRSDDGGDSWARINDNREFLQRAWYYIHVYADPNDRNTLYISNADFWRSVDGGESFEEIDTPHGDSHDMWINPNDPDVLIEGNDGGANVSLDYAETWSSILNQPTAEFYTVTVDNQFPYRVYGPQQDNSTISVPSTDPGGISAKQHWFSVGGCETGPIALDPDDPSVVWSGCYSGVLDRWNRETGNARNVRIYPEMMIGVAPEDLKYRFQWNAPIEMSPHDPSVLYHGSQFVHRTSDDGMTWETISPDLTTVEPGQLAAAGEPITHDETGIEVYPTVFAIQESPHERGVIWAATNDGHVHLTRDDGGSWSEVTPEAMPEEGTVNRIELSPHEPGRAFLAVYRYRRDDFDPYIFRTNDYGQSWTLLTDGENGIPAGYPTRVVREDPERRGLLYAGTEFGAFVSFDDGGHWQPLQLNLPPTPVADLKVHRNDLVVATQGRSFWVLDDLGPLRQLDDEVAGSETWLYAPSDAWRADLGGFGGEETPESAPDGALIRYYFAEPPEGEVTLEILDDAGDVVRTFTGRPDTGEGEDGHGDGSGEEGESGDDGELPVEAGMNTFSWELTREDVGKPEEDVLWGYTGGYRVVPGTYRARLTVGDVSQTRSFEVELDPRLDDVTREDLLAQAELAGAIHDTLAALYDQLRRVRRVREQVKAGLERAEDAGEADGLEARADSLVERLTGLETTLHQTKNESGQDPLNFPPRLDAVIAALYGYVAGPDARPTRSAHDRWEDLRARWSEVHGRIASVITEEVGAFAAALDRRGVPAVVLENAAEGATAEGG